VPALGWARLRRVPSLRSCSVGPRRTDIHVLTALSPHPCGSTHCAKPAFSLHPSRDWRCLRFLRMKIKSISKADQELIKGFPAKAGPTVEVGATFSGYTRCSLVGPASAGKLLILILTFVHRKPRRRPTRLGCRLNADDAQWAEPHGCGESRPPRWMADGGGPTERDRSEGTPTKEGPNREQALLVTFSWSGSRLFKSNSPKAKPKAVRPTLLI
jgi:hypothetical protein